TLRSEERSSLRSTQSGATAAFGLCTPISLNIFGATWARRQHQKGETDGVQHNKGDVGGARVWGIDARCLRQRARRVPRGPLGAMIMVKQSPPQKTRAPAEKSGTWQEVPSNAPGCADLQVLPTIGDYPGTVILTLERTQFTR